jgi:hypothetical protein
MLTAMAIHLNSVGQGNVGCIGGSGLPTDVWSLALTSLSDKVLYSG